MAQMTETGDFLAVSVIFCTVPDSTENALGRGTFFAVQTHNSIQKICSVLTKI